MKAKLTLGALGASFALAASPAQAVILLQYNMQGSVAQAVVASTVAPDVTVSNLVKNNATAPTVQTYSTGQFSNWATTTAASGTTFSSAVTDGNFIGFSITPGAGLAMTLTSLTFQSAAATNSTTSNRAFFVVAENATAAFTSASAVLLTDRTATGGGTLAVQAATASATVASSYTIDLTSFAGAFENLTETKYFRIYLQTPGSNQSISFDNITLNGTVAAIAAVPEPSAYAALAGVGALSLAVFLRRRFR